MRLVHSAILTGLLLFTASAQAATCRVTTSGSNAGNGSNWGAQAMDLLTALGDNGCTEIWVAAGVHKPAAAGDRATSFVIDRNGLKLYGSFAGTESTLGERILDPANPSILSGDIDANDGNTDGNQIAETTSDIVGSNSYHVLYVDGTSANGPIDSSTLIDGFVVTAGQATGADPDDSGGGLFCNGSGAGVSCNPTLNNLTFSGNHADHRGGAVQALGLGGNSSPVLSNVTFAGNNAYYGGAMCVDGFLGASSPTLTNVTFSGNHADSSGGAMYLDGFLGEASPVLIHVSFSGNHAAFYGGAINSTSATGNSNPVLTNVILWGDTAAGNAQEILDNSGTLTISNSVLQGGCNGISSGTVTCTDVIDGDPLLGPLQNNDGFTDTLLPGAGSSAIDAGDDDACLANGIDQRGLSRPQGEACEIGAVEVASGCRVDDDSMAPGGGNGMDWSSAYQNLQDALQDPECQEIWVASGVYKPAAAGNQGASFLINRNGLRLYGGFAGTENSSSRRDPKANVTILSGDIDDNDDSNNADGNFINETSADIVGSNSFHVLHVDGTGVNGPIDGSTVIDGFVITGGQANGSFPDSAGGGLYCNGIGSGKTCNPTLNRLNFVGNSAALGGAMYNRGSSSGSGSPLLIQVAFRGNSASSIGGAMYNDGYTGTSNPDLRSVTFSGNTASTSGGAMYNDGYFGTSSPSLSNATFSGNHANSYGGAMYNNGLSGTSSPLIINTTFNANSASSGGALYNYAVSGASDPQLVNVILWGDTASSGAEVFNATATASFAFSVIQGGCPAGASCNNLFTTDPLLSPLQDLGGFTATMQPGLGGSAVDNGLDFVCPGADQRGVTRPQGPHCDIGAVELTLEIFTSGFE